MAYTPAVAAAVQDKGEPTIVWFDHHYIEQQGTSSFTNVGSTVIYQRMWSDGRLEMRQIRLGSISDYVCNTTSPVVLDIACNVPGQGKTQFLADSGWLEIPAPLGGEGYACRSDVNGDRRVDGIDLATLLSQWGDGVSCDPQPTYPCFDLGNLNLPAG